ncbi:MAG TPA: tail fiber protein [Phycisphaerales bacterium]|nr:tail fiber protein [Phycisphaerales bacterium]
MGAADPFLGEIHLFAGNFAPAGWAFCDGQVMSIAQNTALFSLLGTAYGGNGINTFALPDLRGRAPMHFGQGPGLSQRFLGQSGGVEAVTLSPAQVPSHTHSLAVSQTPGSTGNPSGQTWAASAAGVKNYATPGNGGPTTTMGAGMLAPVGGGGPHTNMQPSLVLSYIIAIQGVYPSRP